MGIFEAIKVYFEEYINVDHDNIVEAYHEGADDVTSTKNVFIDPDTIHSGDDLKQQLESQHPGITDQLWQFVPDMMKSVPDNKDEMLDQLAYHSRGNGAYGWANDEYLVAENGQHLCIINEDPRIMDTKEEIINSIRGNDLDKDIEVPGKDVDYARAIGVHEGTHCEQDKDNFDSERALEVDADRAMLKNLLEHGKTSVAKELYEARAVGANNGADKAHKTASKIDFEKLKEQFNREADGEKSQDAISAYPRAEAEPGPTL